MDFVGNFENLRQRSIVERQKKLEQRIVIKDMPYVYGLMAIASSSGLSGEAAIRCCSEYVPSTLKPQIEKFVREVDSGKSYSNALLSWNEFPNLRPLSHLLIESAESGSSALPALDSLGRDATNRVRRNAETALKKLPVTLLFPLVVCILPAFILLSIVPTLVSGFMSFEW